MELDELLKVLTKNGCQIIIAPSSYGPGPSTGSGRYFDLQINNDEGIVYHDPACDSIRPGLLDIWSQIQAGYRLVPMK